MQLTIYTNLGNRLNAARLDASRFNSSYSSCKGAANELFQQFSYNLTPDKLADYEAGINCGSITVYELLLFSMLYHVPMSCFFTDIDDTYLDPIARGKKGIEQKEVNKMTDKVKIHQDMCDFMHDLYVKKNADYGDSFAKLRARYPMAICIRLFDKLSRLDTLIGGQEQQVKDENINDTLIDIANYCIMELVEKEIDQQRESKENHT